MSCTERTPGSSPAAVQTSPPCRVVTTSRGGEDTWQTIYNAHAVRLRPPQATRTAVAVGRRSSAATSNAGGREVASVAVRIAFQVILVLGLGLPEIAGGRELSHNLSRPQS